MKVLQPVMAKDVGLAALVRQILLRDLRASVVKTTFPIL